MLLLFIASFLFVVMGLGLIFGCHYVIRGIVHRKILALIYGCWNVFISQYMLRELTTAIIEILNKI